MESERIPVKRDKLLRGIHEIEDTPDAVISDHRKHLYPYNRLNKHNCLYEPILDGEDQERTVPEWPDSRSFAVCLTHDVDHVTKYSPRQSCRNIQQTISVQAGRSSREYFTDIVRNSAKLVRDSAKFASLDIDPLHCYERWLDLEASVGATSTFFFLPNDVSQPHFTDNTYRYTDKVTFDGQELTIAEMMSEIHERGWEIGLHPTWNTIDDEQELSYQKQQAESAIGDSVESVRHHYLHYDLRCTPPAQSVAGFKYDSTLGFNGNVGFRFGTSQPWYLYDWKNNQRSDIVEIPLIAQDVALFRPVTGLGLDQGTAIEYLQLLTQRVKQVGGVLTLSWHPSYIVNDEWWGTYEEILTYLNDEGAWFGTVQQIGNWWAEHRD